MSDLPALVARLEAATGPSRSLDAEIYCLVTPGPFLVELTVVPPYTASVDSGRAIMPRGSLWSLFCEDGPPTARVLPPKADGGFIGAKYAQSSAETIEIALCIAALKARAG